MWAAADIYYLADRDPSLRYMWFRNIQAIPGALGQARRMLAGPRPPALVIEINSPASMDPSGRVAAILARRYRLAATVAGVPIYAPARLVGRCADALDQADGQLEPLLERRHLDPLGLGVVVAADRAEAVQGRDPPPARPAAVRDAARALGADREAEVAGVAQRQLDELRPRPASAATCRGRRARPRRPRTRSARSSSASAKSRSAATPERMSMVARACPGTVFGASPPETVVTTDVMSGPAGRQALDAQHLVGERRDGAAAEGGVGAGVGRAAVQVQRSPERALAGRDDVAVSAPALEHERGRRARGPRRRRPARAGAPPRRRRSAGAAPRTAASGIAASRSTAIAASTRPPFMSATPGPGAAIAVAPEPPPRPPYRARRPCRGGPSSATIGPPSPVRVTIRLRAGLSGSSTHRCVQPAGASHAATCSATPSCSSPPDGESVSTSACSRLQKTSVGEADKGVTLPARTGAVVPCGYGGGA